MCYAMTALRLRLQREGDDLEHVDEELAALAQAVAAKKDKKSEWSALGTPWIKMVWLPDHF